MTPHDARSLIVTEVLRYAYCSSRHEVFDLPREPTTLWRYMTLPKLLMLLDSRRLFFCRASKLEDRFEGAIPRVTETNLEAWESQHVSEEVRGEHRTQRRRLRDNVAISCWHMSEHESDAMWSRYGLTNEGVAIKSSIDRLTRALPQWPNKHTEGPGAIFIGKVRYIDYAKATYPPHNVYFPYVHKRESFKHENELRAVTMISKAAAETAASGTAEFEVSEGGIAVQVDIATLVDGIYTAATAPPWFQHIVRISVERFGFDSISVMNSEMAEDPIY